MIASLYGTLEAIAEDQIVVRVGGVGLQVTISASLQEMLGAVGSQIVLHTFLIVREKELTLYGFSEAEERALFEILLGVPGVGPRLALAILSTLSPEVLSGAVARDEPEVLTRVPGIGKKTAQKMIFELKGRLDPDMLPAGLMAISDTDTHTFLNLRTAGARTWTAASAGMDTPSTLDPAELAASVVAGRAVGGQGVYVQTRLLATDGSGAVADLTQTGSTSVTSGNAAVDFEVTVQSPSWAQWDTIEIYSNAGGNVSSVVVDPLNPYLYTAVPIATLKEGDCSPTTTADGDFDITVADVFPAIAAAERWETTVSVPFIGLTADTWFVAVVKGTDAVCEPMFPVYPDDIGIVSNLFVPSPPEALVDGNLGEDGVMALGVTNALYFTAP